MQDVYQNIISLLDNLQTTYPVAYSILLTIGYGIGIFLIILIIQRFLHLFRSRSPNLIDGLDIILNFSALAIWVAISAPLFNVPQSYIYGGSALGVAIIGVSASYLGANFMGGLFIIFSRPFGVGDIINYNGTVGLVTEIGLNYTKLLKLNRTELTVCNSNIVNALIHNSSVFVKPDHQKDQIELELADDDPNKDNGKKGNMFLANKAILKFNPNKLTQSVFDTINIKKIVRLSYTFDIKTDLPNYDVSVRSFEKRLKQLCKNFTDKFGFEPEFFFVDNYWRLTTTFVITAVNARMLFDNYSIFLEGIVKSAYEIDLGG